MAVNTNSQNVPVLLRLPEVIRRTGYQKSTLYHLASKGEFPSPIPLGARAVAWPSNEIDDWIQARISGARKAA